MHNYNLSSCLMFDIEVLYFVMICGADLLGVFWYFDYDKSFSCIITIYHHVYYLFLLLFLCNMSIFGNNVHIPVHLKCKPCSRSV
jgi:hypothetical protein